jgi:hypothetical protein
MYVALFGLVTSLEIIMAKVIRLEFAGTDGWRDCLFAHQRTRVQREIDKAKNENRFAGALLLTSFSEKVTIISKSPRLEDAEGFARDLKDIRELLRNPLAHADDFAASNDAAKQTCEAVRRSEWWSKYFSEWLKTI